MESNFLTAVFLPVALFILMLGMGLELTLDDFKRVVVYPKAAVVGLLAQLAMLPLVGFLLASLFPLKPELAVGVVILAASPGGPTSNLLTFLAAGDVALSITLTAISSVVTVFTIPLIINAAMGIFLGSASVVQLPLLETILQIFVITILPVVLGMLLKHKVPAIATKVNKPLKYLSIFFLTVIIVGVILRERQNIVGFFVAVGLVMLSLNLSTMLLGYGMGFVMKLSQPQKVAITLEVGIQNGTLAIAIASAPTLLNNPTMAIPAAIYSLIMFVTGGLFSMWSSSQKPAKIFPNA